MACAGILCVLISAEAASARPRPRVSAQAPAFAFVKSMVAITGHSSGISRGARVGVLVQRHGQRWQPVAAGRLRSHGGAFSLQFRAPDRAQRIAVRVELLSGSRVLTVTKASRIVVELRPLVIPGHDIVSAPPPGQAGVVVLWAHLPGRVHAGRATTASSCPPLPGAPHVGQVTATGYSPMTPYGSLKKINFISVQPPCKITLQTGEATLPQLVGNSGASINYSTLRDVNTGRAASAGTSFSRPLSKSVACSGGASASLSGSLSFGITPTLHASFSRSGGLSSASFSVAGSAGASLSANVQASVGCKLSNVRLVPPFDIATFQGTVGGWPVVITVRGMVDANARLSASAHTTVGVSAHESVTGGVGYGKPSGPCAGRSVASFYPIYCGPTSNPFSFTPPTVSATASATATITPRLEALLYGAAGPQVSLTTGLDFSADAANHPWWTLNAPLNIDGSLVAPVLGLSTGSSLPLHRSSFTLKTASGAFNAAAVNITNPGDQTGAAGTPANLQIQASDTDGGTLTYTAIGLPPGLSINSSTGLITGTPTAAGISSVTLTASDATGPSKSTSFTWTIAPSGWTIQSSPALGGDAELDSVSCTSSDSCIAVGSRLTATSGRATLAEFWDGASWQINSTPDPAGGHDSELFGVSCTSSSACTAVGSYQDSSNTGHVLVERWDGTSWQIQNAPDPAGGNGSYLRAVSCTSSTACTAVGVHDASTNTTLAETWDGTSWQIHSTVDIPDATETDLLAVSCTSSDACFAVGTYQYPPPNPGSGTPEGGTLAEVWDGTNWQVQNTPSGAYDGFLHGVSCTSPQACMAVGDSVQSSGAASVPLAERWDGTNWQIEPTTTPASTTLSELDAVSCSQPAACIAVGQNQTTAGADTLAESWDNTSWQIQGTPNPGPLGAASTLTSVSCTSSTRCTAVGATTYRGESTLAERYSGT